MKKLWVDDIRDPPSPVGEWRVFRRYSEALNAIVEGNWDEVDLDHDLGNGPFGNDPEWMHKEKTGYDLLLYIVAMKLDGKKVGIVRVHTSNPAGHERMMGVVERYELGPVHPMKHKPWS